MVSLFRKKSDAGNLVLSWVMSIRRVRCIAGNMEGIKREGPGANGDGLGRRGVVLADALTLTLSQREMGRSSREEVMG